MYKQNFLENFSTKTDKGKKSTEKSRQGDTNVFRRMSDYKSSREIAGPSAELSGFGASPENDYGDHVWKISSRYNVNTFETFEALREHVHKIKEELLSER